MQSQQGLDLNTETPTPKKIGCFKIGCSATLLLGLLSGATLVGVVVSSRKASQSEMERLRAGGHPTTIAELNAYQVQPAPEVDTTQLWESAFRILKEKDFSSRYRKLQVAARAADNYKGPPNRFETIGPFPDIGKPWAGEADAELILADIADALRAMHQAERRGSQAKFHSDYRTLNFFTFEMQFIMDVARALHLEAVINARRGNVRQATQSIHTLFGLSESIRNEPLLMQQLIRISTLKITVNTLIALLTQVAFADTDLLRMQAMARGFDTKGTFRRVVDGERCMNLDFLNKNFRSWIPGERSYHLEVLAQLEAIADEPVQQWRESAIAKDAESPNARPMIQKALQEMQSQGYRISANYYSSIADYFVENEARLRLCDLMIACELYRRKNGDWPASIVSLVPEFLPVALIDPYNGKPLLMTNDDLGLTLSSAGSEEENGGSVPGNMQNTRLNVKQQIHLPPAAQMPR